MSEKSSHKNIYWHLDCWIVITLLPFCIEKSGSVFLVLTLNRPKNQTLNSIWYLCILHTSILTRFPRNAFLINVSLLSSSYTCGFKDDLVFLKNGGNWNKKKLCKSILVSIRNEWQVHHKFYHISILLFVSTFVSWNCNGMWNFFCPFDFFRIFSFCKKADLICFVHHLFAFMMVLCKVNDMQLCTYLILTNHHQRAHTGLFRYVNLLIINFYVYLITRTLHNIYLCFFTMITKYQ